MNNKNIATAIKSWPARRSSQTDRLLCWLWGRVDVSETGGDGSVVLYREAGGRSPFLMKRLGRIWIRQQNQRCQLPYSVPWNLWVGLSCLVFEIWPRDGRRTERRRQSSHSSPLRRVSTIKVVTSDTCNRQEAQLSQKDRVTLLVTEYFAKSLKVIEDHSKRHCWVGRV